MENQKSTNSLNKLLNHCEDINEFIDVYDDHFIDAPIHIYMTALVNEKGLTIPSVIRESDLSESYGYQLFNGSRKASRDKLLQLAIGIKLTVDETNKLLKTAKLSSLYCRDKKDAIIIFALNNGLSVMDTDELLYSNNQKTLK